MAKTQLQRVVEHVAKHGCITSLTAIREYNITRLSAIVYKLKETQFALKEGYRDDYGFSVYVPDHEARMESLRTSQSLALADAQTAEDAARVCAHYTALYMKAHQEAR